MKQIQKQWLAAVPWATVLSINQALCRAQKTEHKPNAANCLTAQQAWEAAMLKQMTLPNTLEICKACYNLAPFISNNANTFAAIAKTLIEDFLRAVPPVEAHIIRTTVAHYVAGLIGKRELLNILEHFEPMLKSPPAPASVESRETSVESPALVPRPSTLDSAPAPPIQSAQPSH